MEQLRERSRWRTRLWRAAGLILAYGAAETVCTLAYWLGWLDRGAYFLVEDRGQPPIYRFDPIAGYRLGPFPTRQLCFTSTGTLQSSGVLRGNNRGYPDEDDFSPRRARTDQRRFAVFGDSFTAAQFLEVNWPRRGEELLAATGQDVELLNFAVDGGGFLNWWSILTREVWPEDYELDGVILAVAVDDLTRRFFVRADERLFSGRYLRMGRVWSLAPEDWPQTVAAARDHFLPAGEPVVSPAHFAAYLAGKRDLRRSRAWQPYLASTVRSYYYFLTQFRPPPTPPTPLAWDQAFVARAEELAREFRARQLPVLVLNLWTPAWEAGMPREPATTGDYPAPLTALAALLDADYLDGSEAFAGLSSAELATLNLEGDRHWNQAGSDRFAQWLAERLGSWP